MQQLENELVRREPRVPAPCLSSIEFRIVDWSGEALGRRITSQRRAQFASHSAGDYLGVLTLAKLVGVLPAPLIGRWIAFSIREHNHAIGNDIHSLGQPDRHRRSLVGESARIPS